MKYMNFNSSCAYAGLANMLAFYGVETEDYKIAEKMGLPYYFAKENGTYKAGPMLQGKRWFDLFLLPEGFCLEETKLEKNQIPDFLTRQKCAMIGIKTEFETKHAVVYCGKQGDKLIFLNNKKKDSEEPSYIRLSPQELPARLEEISTVALLKRREIDSAPCAPAYAQILQESLAVFRQMKREIIIFCKRPQSWETLMAARDVLFRPILLDAVNMLPLIGEKELCEKLRFIQAQYVQILRRKKNEDSVLARELSMPVFEEAMELYEKIIEEKYRISFENAL